jgi:hypothetical protein
MEPPTSKMTPQPPKEAAKGYALRFISGKYQGGEYPLPKSGEVVIGRSSELDMVLVEDMVSRRHAKISVTDDEISIQDLGSTNGTFVNGEKVTRAKLNEGDRVLIGTSIIKVVASELQPKNKSRQKLEDIAAGRRRTSQVRTMSGSIGEVPLSDLLQLFSASKKSGVLTIRTDRDVGRLYLQNGRVVYASLNDTDEVPALKCIYRILTWEDGTFDMEAPEEREFPETLDTSTEALLMESMRQVDEIRRLQEDMPSPTATLALAVPMRSSLRELTPEELDVVQLVHNYGEVQAVMDKSRTSDLDTSQRILKLINSGYLQTE